MAFPEMIPVESSAIASVGYDTNASKLYVEYVGGARYAYLGVPEIVFDDLLSAGSKGQFVNVEIKPHYDVRPL